MREGNDAGEADWSLDEEVVLPGKRGVSTPSISNKTSMRSSEQWWRITSPYDPALNAEPAHWDGEGLAASESSQSFDEYPLIQDTWEEHNVT
ncbi:uncharacterized protein LOC122263995 isoform X2 [Penaeus japonicus]|uniref:uncharacterized protein LOC122263995 isoform X2 n=1 Tax=Penaeus japonicus TaxID=27405 RepID=UPI001C714B37|nr:uncharacterized protein LOC122263995 isoform X2 [Penaeus japonicus]